VPKKTPKTRPAAKAKSTSKIKAKPRTKAPKSPPAGTSGEPSLDAQLLEALRFVEPIVQRIAVKPRQPELNIHLLELAHVCYITSDFTIPPVIGFKPSTMYACDDGTLWYNNVGLLDLEKLFANGGNPWFLRTSRQHLINVKKVRGDRIADARDLYFDGFEDPVIGAVSRGEYLDVYNQCPHFILRPPKA